MRLFSLLLALFMTLTVTLQSHADVPFSPFRKDMKAAMIDAQADIVTLQALPSNHSYLTEGISNVRVARVTYDVATDLGTIGAHLLGVTLPAKSIITRSFFYTDTQFVDGGAGTVALSCEDANNIKTATDITGNAVGVIVEGESTGAASAFKASIAADCEVTATVAGAAQTAGKLTAYIYYVVTD
jgi:hypothetical protein